MMTNQDIQIKCVYYNRGYCKNKNKCQDYHPKEDCNITNCRYKECKYRHRKLCKYGEECYHNINDNCEYVHLNNDEKQQNQAHRVILRAPSPNQIEQMKDEIEKYKMEIDRYKAEIEQYTIEIHNGKETLKEKNEIIKKQAEENDDTKELLKQAKEVIEQVVTENNKRYEEYDKRYEEYEKKIEKKYNETINSFMEKYKGEEKMEEDTEMDKKESNAKDDNNEQIVEINKFKCEKCNFKTNWENNFTEHRGKCKKNKRKK